LDGLRIAVLDGISARGGAEAYRRSIRWRRRRRHATVTIPEAPPGAGRPPWSSPSHRLEGANAHLADLKRRPQDFDPAHPGPASWRVPCAGSAGAYSRRSASAPGPTRPASRALRRGGRPFSRADHACPPRSHRPVRAIVPGRGRGADPPNLGVYTQHAIVHRSCRCSRCRRPPCALPSGRSSSWRALPGRSRAAGRRAPWRAKGVDRSLPLTA